ALDLGPRLAPVPALERLARIAVRDEQDRPAPSDPRAPRLRHELQDLAQVGHHARFPPDLDRSARDRAPAALDPRAQLADRVLGVALRRAARQHDLDLAVAVHAHPHAPGTIGAADAVRHGHGRWRVERAPAYPHVPDGGIPGGPTSRCARTIHGLREWRQAGIRSRLPRRGRQAGLPQGPQEGGPARVLALVHGRMGYWHLW